MRRKNYTNLFTEAKSRVTPHEAAERCGRTPNRSGYILCPFHDDHSPSMKVYPDGFHCFSCGAHTDVIGLVARCRGISLYEAARSLVGQDFIPSAAPAFPRCGEDPFRDWELRTFIFLRKFRFLLLDFREKYRPPIDDDDTSTMAPFLLSIHHLDRVEEFLRILTQGSEEERYAMYQHNKEVIHEYERLYDEYRNA